jgi:hypothetical protein
LDEGIPFDGNFTQRSDFRKIPALLQKRCGITGEGFLRIEKSILNAFTAGQTSGKVGNSIL